MLCFVSRAMEVKVSESTCPVVHRPRREIILVGAGGSVHIATRRSEDDDAGAGAWPKAVEGSLIEWGAHMGQIAQRPSHSHFLQ